MLAADGRCHSWRPGAKAHNPRHDPGRCRRCWQPCWNKVPRDGVTVRCDGCIDAILAINRPRVTRLMLEEPYVPERLSERLASDLDAGVAMAANELLLRSAAVTAESDVEAEREIADEPTVETPPVAAADPAIVGVASSPGAPEREQDIDVWADKW